MTSRLPKSYSLITALNAINTMLTINPEGNAGTYLCKNLRSGEISTVKQAHELVKQSASRIKAKSG